ncbi:hypothetical protein J1614_010646 [Plenodomus biglobosus]|nr:hypothetical protein J1614_010646 [Plenodomus biglobosus]
MYGKKKLAKRALGKRPMSEDVDVEAHPAPPSPQPSIYTQAPVALHVGLEKTVYYVPKHLLPSHWIEDGEAREYSFCDLDDGTGHTLVHYLYTGNYETLHCKVSSRASDRIQRALLVYFMANKYDLHDLEQLAKQEIEQQAVELSICEVLEAIKEHFVRLEPDSFVHEIVREKTKETCEENDTLLKTDALLKSLDNAALSRFMMKCVVDGYSSMILQAYATQREMQQAVDNRDQTTPNVSDNGPGCEMTLPKKGKAIEPLAEQTALDECYAEDAYEEATVTTEGFYTISCPPSESTVNITSSDTILEEQGFDSDFRMPELCTGELVAPPEEPCPIESFVPCSDLGQEVGMELELRSVIPAEEAVEGVVAVEEAVEEALAVEEETAVVVEEECATGTTKTASQPGPELMLGEGLQVCPLQTKHMMKEQRWRKCKTCRAVLQEIASRLSRTGEDEHHSDPSGVAIT